MTAIQAKDLPAPPPLAALDCAALFLDLDGTLAAIQARPEDVGPEPWRTRLLQRLQVRLHGRVAVVSGRSLEDVDRILEGAARAVAAVHGLVRRRPDGMVMLAPPDPALADARARAFLFAGRHQGVRLEDKTLGVAMHYREAPALEDQVRKLATAIARDHGLKLQLGHMVAEICTPGFDKGMAVTSFMGEPPFAGSIPLFVGDDLTDEDGFRAAQAHGGLGVLVGPPRATEARRRLPDIEAVRAWLEAEGDLS